MRRYELRDILEGTGGDYTGDLPESPVFLSLERDSRKVKAGDVYLAVKGEVHDGHRFVEDAFANGAATAIVSRSWAEAHPEFPHGLIVVDEPVQALQRWAAWRREKLNVRVVGITGSVGKTSAKESIAAVLAQRWRVHKSPGNYNNEIGLPWALLDCPDDAEVLVLEMGGAFAFGELTLLAGIAKPDVAVVTNIYPVHIERMGSIEAIAQTKQELVEAIPDDGLVVLNGDDFRVRNMIAATNARVITYGLDDPADIKGSDVQSEGLKGTSFWVEIDGEQSAIKVPFIGAQGVQIALVAIAVGHGFGMHISEILLGLQDPRIQVRLLFIPGPNGSQLIDDTYNASAPSVLAALSVLEQLPAKRKIAVLGEMRELGHVSEAEHRVVGGRAGDVADVVVTFGDLARFVHEEAVTAERPADRPLEVYSFSLDQRDDLIAFLKGELREGDVALLKGARGLEMETIVSAIRPHKEKPAEAHPEGGLPA